MSALESKYSNTKKKPGKTKAFFICLLIASFLWLIHSLNTVYTYTFRLPVEFRNLPQNKRPLGTMPEMLRVDVKASGLKLALMLLSKSNKQMIIDFNAINAGNRGQNVVLSSSKISFKDVLGFEAQVRRISPDTLYFSEKTGFQKNVWLKVPIYISCREGYANKKPEITPSFVTIYGDTNDLGKIDTIYTQPVNLSDLNQNISVKPAIIKPKAGIYASLAEASVFIEVQKLEERSITIPITDLRDPEKKRVNFFPSFVKVKFTTIQNSLNKQDTALFKATIDSDKINKHTKKCLVTLSTLPGNVSIIELEPEEVEVLILKKR